MQVAVFEANRATNSAFVSQLGFTRFCSWWTGVVDRIGSTWLDCASGTCALTSECVRSRFTTVCLRDSWLSGLLEIARAAVCAILWKPWYNVLVVSSCFTIVHCHARRECGSLSSAFLQFPVDRGLENSHVKKIEVHRRRCVSHRQKSCEHCTC